MKHQPNEVELDLLITEAMCEASEWPQTDAAVDAYLTTLDEAPMDGRLSQLGERVAERLKGAWASSARPVVLVRHETLFGPDEAVREEPKLDGLDDLVAAAFRAMSNGVSIDLVIADPQHNAAFIHECWKRDAQASAFTLNWALLNARKAGKIGGVASSRFHIRSFNVLCFAAEFALRHMQDSAYRESRQGMSLDHILCDPRVADEFEQLCRRLAPGYQSVEYRWSALRVRKSLRRDSQNSPCLPDDFEVLGATRSIRPQTLTQSPGLIWARSGEQDIYFGAATNLREQVEKMLDVPEARQMIVPPWLGGDRYSEMSVAVSVFARPSVEREAIKASIVGTKAPVHNVVSWSGLMAAG